jgi:hypothetical protein
MIERFAPSVYNDIYFAAEKKIQKSLLSRTISSPRNIRKLTMMKVVRQRKIIME